MVVFCWWLYSIRNSRDSVVLDSCTSNTSLDTTLALLQMEAAKAEEESEVREVMPCAKSRSQEQILEGWFSFRRAAIEFHHICLHVWGFNNCDTLVSGCFNPKNPHE